MGGPGPFGGDGPMGSGGSSGATPPPGVRAILSDVQPVPEWQLAAQQAQQQGMIPGMVQDPETVIRLLTEDRIIQQTQFDVAESAAARQRRENDWRVSADLYNNVPDDEGKADWQARVFIPQIFLKVELACSLVKSSFFQDPQWFTLEQVPAWDPGTADVKFVEHVTTIAAEAAMFPDAYGRSLEEGFLFGSGCLKIVWEQYIDRTPELIEPDQMAVQQAMMMGQPPPQPTISTLARPRSRLRCYQVPIWNIYPDPYHDSFYDGRYTVEEIVVDQEEIEEGIRAGRYNCLSSVEDLGEPCGLTHEYERLARDARLTYSPRRGPRKLHLLQIRYGNYYDDQGKLLVQNWVTIIANKKKVISLDNNPSFTGKRPYIWCTPIPVRGSVWGREIIFAAKPLQVALNAIYNLMIDSTSYSVIPAVTINRNRLDSDEEIDGVSPGATFYVTADNAVQPLKIASTPNEAMPMVQDFERKIDEATMMYGTLAGESPLKGRATATQYQGEITQGQGQASLLARGLETRDIEPAVQLIYENLLQFLGDVSDPKLQEAFSLFTGPQTFLDPATRFRLLNAKFKVKARGVTGIVERKTRTQNMMQLATMAQQLQMPFRVQGKMFYRTASSMNIDPRELDAPPDEAAWEVFEQQMMMQQQAAGAPGGGGSSGRAASPEPPPSAPGAPGPPDQTAQQNQMAAQMGPPGMPGG